MDVMGPMSQTGWGGAKYVLTVTDDFATISFVYCLKLKGEVKEKCIVFKNMAEKLTGLNIKILRKTGNM